MKRKINFLVIACITSALILQTFCVKTQTAAGKPAEELKLENDHLSAVFDPSNGSLVKLTNKKTGWNVISRKQLAQSFEMLVPLKWKRFHLVEGNDQLPPKIETSENKITFTWTSLKSKLLDKPLGVTFIGVVELTKDGLCYSGKVINNDNTYTIEYIAWPYWGELSIPDTISRFVSESMFQTKELFPAFVNEQGYWGADYPTQSITLPESAYISMRNDKQGIIGFSEQIVPEELVVASQELIPGYEYNNLNPRSEEMDGQAVRIPFKVNRFCFTAPSQSRELIPFDLSFYEGAWQKGADLYKSWKETAVKQADHSTWINQPYTWQYVSVSNAQELVDLAKEGSKYGVSALHVNGWRAPDNQNDIKGIEGLASAIKECQKLGVKIVLDLQINNEDKHSTWYKNELGKYAIINMFGMTTNPQMLCPSTKGMIDIVENKYAKNSDLLSADGIIINDNNNNGATYFCFSPDHGHAVPEFVQTGTYNLDRMFTEQIKKTKPEMAVLGYGFFDMQTAYYDGNRADSRSDRQRYVNANTPMIILTGERNARNDMNLCLKNRFTICYNFSLLGRDLKNYPLIIKYGQEIEALRHKYGDFLWDGEYQDKSGAVVSGGNISYSVFKNKDGRKAVIIINNGTDNATEASVSIEGSKKPLVIASPENLGEKAFTGSVSINPLSAVVVMEK